MDFKNKKCVIVIDESLELGLIANTATIIGLTLGKEYPELIGVDVIDKSGRTHLGITGCPIPVLKGSQENIQRIYDCAYLSDLVVVDFSNIAQLCLSYDDYIEKMKMTDNKDMRFFGLAIYGDKKIVNKLTGSLPLLR